MRRKIRYILFIPVVVGFILWYCSGRLNTNSEKNNKSTETELTRILKSGKLKAVVDYNSTNYFIYQGIPMGFKYEILQHLANDMQVKLELSVNNNQEESFNELIGKKYDLIAKNLIITRNRNQNVSYTEPLEQSRQVLVQRKPKNWQLLTANALEDSLIRNQLDLAGKKVYVLKNSVYYNRMINLSEEIGEEIDIVQDSIYGMEQLIAMVAKGEIGYTV